MANFPGPNWHLPWADPPVTIILFKGNEPILETDDCGIKFKILGDFHAVAMACIERTMESIKSVSNNNFRHRFGAIRFIIENREIVEAEPEFHEYVEHVSHMPENRPEVLKVIELINKSLESMKKMKAFW